MTIKEKYYSINQSNLSNEQITFLKKIKDLTNDFETTDTTVLNKAESALDKIIKVINLKQPEALKQEKQVVEIKQPEVSKQTKKVVKTKKPVNKRKSSSTTTQKKPTIFSKAKEIRKEGESWESAKARATKMIKGEKEEVVKVMNSELKSLLQVVRRRKELKAKYGKKSYELGGAFMNTDLAGHSGGGTGGLNTGMPLSGVSGTYYTGLVGETGAMSSGEMFKKGGELPKLSELREEKNGTTINFYQDYGNIKFNTQVFKIGDLYTVNQGGSNLGMWDFYNQKFKNRNEAISFAKDSLKKQIEEYKAYYMIPKNIKDYVGKHFIYGHNVYYIGGLRKNAIKQSLRSQRTGKIVDVSGQYKPSFIVLEIEIDNKLSPYDTNQKVVKGSVLHIIDLDDFKKKKYFHISSKKLPSKIQEQIDSKKAYFERFENQKYEFGGAMMQNQQVINDASQPYVITESFGNPAQQLGMLAKGGAIINQYEGRTPEDVWNNWTEKQRSHFLLDHSDLLDKDRMENNLGYTRTVQKDKTFAELTAHTKGVLEAHVRGGQYESGGSFADGGDIINYKVTISYPRLPLKGERTNWHYEEYVDLDIPAKNEKEAKKKALIKFYEMFPNESPQISGVYSNKYNPFNFLSETTLEKGGSFAPNVSDGTQFMSDVYANGGGMTDLNGEFEVATFSSEEAEAEVIEGGLTYKEALKLANKLWNSGKEYGVEIINSDSNALDPIVWIKSKDNYANGGSFAPNVSDGTQFMSDVYAKGGEVDLISIKEQYEENVNLNNNSENVVLLAKYFGNTDDLKEAKKILSRHYKEGYLSAENSENRTKLSQKLIDKARKEMSKKGIEFAYGGMNNLTIQDVSFENGGSFAPNVSNGTQFMSDVYANGGGIRSQEELKKIFYEKKDIVKNLTPKEIAEMWNKNSYGVKQGISKPMTIEEAKRPTMKIYLQDLLIENELTEDEQAKYFANGGSFAPNVSNGTQFMSDVYAKGGGMTDLNGEFEVATFSSEEAEAEVIEGGLTYKEALKLANKLWNSGKEYGVEIINSDSNALDPIVWIKSKDNYANGGSFAPNVSNGTQFMSDVYASGGSFVDGGRMDYWEDYHEDSKKIQNPTNMQIEQEVEACVEFWNDNNEMGEENEVNNEGEKIVIKLAKEFAKAKGYISSDIIDAMIAQETYADGGSLPFMTDPNFGNFQNTGAFANGGAIGKVYLMTGIYGAKGIPGKVLFAFKKEIEKQNFKGDVNSILSEINNLWSKWSITEGAEIIKSQVIKIVDENYIQYITATLNKFKWEPDTINGLNVGKSNELYIKLSSDFVINIGFNDDIDANKFAKKLSGMVNTAINYNQTEVFGYYQEVGDNNVEIRESMIILIESK